MPARPLLEDAHRESAPSIAISIPVRLVGAVILVLVVVMMASLASWSVDDPSLSFATSKQAANWLGFPGAVIADLSFQILGLATLVMLVPPALWGWSLIRRVVPSRMPLRVLAWIGATLLSTGVLAFIAVPQSWPLPTGLGGLIGAGFSNLAELATGDNPQPVTAVLFAIILVAPTLALLWVALGIGSVIASKRDGIKDKVKRTGKNDDAPDRTGILDIAIGALVRKSVV